MTIICLKGLEILSPWEACGNLKIWYSKRDTGRQLLLRKNSCRIFRDEVFAREEIDMFDLKQLKYFIVCAETGSISEAAKLLYTTQPSVSKAIKALEEEMGIVLFERMPRGIALTAKGREAYRYACRIINDSRILEEMSHGNMAKYLRISLNPSSWFTNQFVEFYKENYEKDYHFEIYTAGVRTVMERVRDYLSDIGFVYVMEPQKKEFQYELAKNRLVFNVMQESTATFYPGKLNPLNKWKNASEKEKICAANMEQMKDCRFIQNFRDEFLELNDKEKHGVFSWEDLDVSIITNSDYIMEKMLKETELCNISGSYLSDDKKAVNKGIPLDFRKNKVFFGYIRRKNDDQDELIDELLEFLNEKLKTENLE